MPTREEVIEEIEYYRDTFKAMSERAGRLALSLRHTATGQAPQRPEPRDAEGDAPPSRSGKVDFSGDPTASSPLTLVTPKQLGMIRALAREASVDYEAECVAQLDCKPEDLSKRAASAFIDYLQLIKDEGAEFRKVG